MSLTGIIVIAMVLSFESQQFEEPCTPETEDQYLIELRADDLQLTDAEAFVHSIECVDQLKSIAALNPLIELLRFLRASWQPRGHEGSPNRCIVNTLLSTFHRRELQSQFAEEAGLARVLGETKPVQRLPASSDRTDYFSSRGPFMTSTSSAITCSWPSSAPVRTIGAKSELTG